MTKTPVEGVIGRIKETFSFTLKNLRGIMLPLIVINLISVFALLYLVDFLIPLGVIGIILLVAFFIAYIILSFGVNIGIIKYISNNIKTNTSGGDCKESISYGFSNILKGLKVGLWYVIVYLILPIVLLIIGYVLFVIGGAGVTLGAETTPLPSYEFMGVGLIIMLVAYVWLTIKSIRIIFVMYYAIDRDDYSKEQFNKSIAYTKDNWWRILGNILFASIIFGLVYFASTIATTFYTTLNQNSLSTISTLAIELVNGLLAALFGGFITVFSYLLAKRLEFEAEGEIEGEVNNKSTVLKEKSVEL